MAIYNFYLIFTLMPEVVTVLYTPIKHIDGTDFFSVEPKLVDSPRGYGKWVSFQCVPKPTYHRIWYFAENTFDHMHLVSIDESSLKEKVRVEPSNDRYEIGDILWVRYLSHFIGKYICQVIRSDGAYQEADATLHFVNEPTASPPAMYYDDYACILYVLHHISELHQLRVILQSTDSHFKTTFIETLYIGYGYKHSAPKITKVEALDLANKTGFENWVLAYYEGIGLTSFVRIRNTGCDATEAMAVSAYPSKSSPTSLIVEFHHKSPKLEDTLPYQIELKPLRKGAAYHEQFFSPHDIKRESKGIREPYLWRATFTGLPMYMKYKAVVSYKGLSSKFAVGWTTVLTPPLPIRHMSISSITNTSITLQWNYNTSSLLVVKYYVMFGESQSTLQRIPVTETSFIKDGLVPNKDYQLQVGVEEEGIVSETLAKFHFRTASNERWQEFENLRREEEARTEALKKLNLRRDSALKNRNEIAEKLTVKKRMWKAMEEKEPQIQDIESDLKQLWNEAFAEPDNEEQHFYFIITSSIFILVLLSLLILKKSRARAVVRTVSARSVKSSIRTAPVKKPMEASSSTSKTSVIESSTKSVISSAKLPPIPKR